jgi:hypothetical protein
MAAAATPYATQGGVLLDRLTTYFTENDYATLEQILPIINGVDDVSLRLVDWFVTNYAKKALTSYTNTSGRRFVVHVEYKLRLRSYRKRQFDPFCRWERIEIPYRDGTVVTTTIGQLNFFKWALDNKVIQFIRDNRKAVEADMNTRNSTARARPIAAASGSSISSDHNKTRRKRQELTTSPSKALSKQLMTIKMDFQ